MLNRIIKYSFQNKYAQVKEKYQIHPLNIKKMTRN